MHKPPGFTTLFPYIFATDADAYLAFLRDGLGGDLTLVHRSPEGRVLNAQIVFDDTTIMVSEAAGRSAGEDFAPTQATYYLYVENADAAVARAVAAGGTSIGAVRDQPYGDRQGGVRDPQGNVWWISQRLEAGAYQ